MSAPVEQKVLGMSLGAEPKKVAFLAVLVVVGAVTWFMNRDESQPLPPMQQASAKTPPKIKSITDPDAIVGSNGGANGAPQKKRQGSRQAISGSLREFKVSLKPDKDNPIDPSKVDPTLRLASLARSQTAGMTGGSRSLFDFGSAQTTENKVGSVIITPKPLEVAIYGPQKPPPIPGAPPPPPPPPIPLKFYGFVTAARTGGAKRAFFMENEDIYIASEGEMVKNRYKLIRIGVNTVVMEDTQFKSQQTIKLTDEAQTAN